MATTDPASPAGAGMGDGESSGLGTEVAPPPDGGDGAGGRKDRKRRRDNAAKGSKQAKYRYEAVDLDGKTVKGDVTAQSVNQARNELAVQGLRVRKISEKKGLQTEITPAKVPLEEVMHFSRQMGTFLRSGVPMTEAISNLAIDADNKRFREVLEDVLEQVGTGARITDALAQHSDVFPSYFMAMLGAAELTGRMDVAFDRLHRYVKRDIQLRRAVRRALVYPMILLGLSVVVVGVIVVFAIPRFATFFEEFDAELPLPTRMLMSVADFVTSPYGLVTGIVLVVLAIAIAIWARTQGGRRAIDGMLLRLPLTRKVVQYSSTERFTRVLGALLESGVPLPQALPSAVDASNNLVFKERLTTAMESVLQGAGFAGPLQETELFPATVIQMIRVGERSGELARQLENAATFYEEELEYAIEKMTAWFEPLTVIFIGVVVGFVAVAMVSAMYGIYNQVDF
jgi:type IV pilus assembly protein PilC